MLTERDWNCTPILARPKLVETLVSSPLFSRTVHVRLKLPIKGAGTRTREVSLSKH